MPRKSSNALLQLLFVDDLHGQVVCEIAHEIDNEYGEREIYEGEREREKERASEESRVSKVNWKRHITS